MKRHLFGSLVGLVAFVAGFLASPIYFKETGRGGGLSRDLQHPCYVVAYNSSHFETLTVSTCTFETEQQARDDFFVVRSEAVRPERSMLFETMSGPLVIRTLVEYREAEKTYFCSLRANGNVRTDICSTSRRHVVSFEGQRILRW